MASEQTSARPKMALTIGEFCRAHKHQHRFLLPLAGARPGAARDAAWHAAIDFDRGSAAVAGRTHSRI
jgi:hypothetical protein